MHSGLSNILQRLRQRWLRVAALSATGWGISVLLATGIVAAWSDLVWELSPDLRIGAIVFSVAAAAVCGAVIVVSALRLGRGAWLARSLDRAAHGEGEIITGYDLSHSERSMPAISAALAALAVERATQLAERVEVSDVVPARRLRRPWLVAGAFGAVVLVVGLALPRLLTTEAWRFFDPYGDHPPWSPLVFRVQPGDTEVNYGAGLKVETELSGPDVDQVDLVVRDAHGVEETLPMFPREDSQWHAALVDLRAPLEYYVRAGRARSHRFRITVMTVPQIKLARFRVTPPAYTNQSPYEGPLPEDGLSGLSGTEVQVWATSNRPLKAGTLELTTDGSKRPSNMSRDESDDTGRTVTGGFTIAANGRFDVRVADLDGQFSLQDFSGTVKLLADERPFVHIVQPPAVALATPDAVLPVEVDAEDDYGVTQIELFRSLNQSRSLPQESQLAAPLPARWRETTLLDLADYELEPGDEIRLYARAEDNDPAGAKGYECSIVTVRIVAQEEFERMIRTQQGLELLQSKYQQAARRLEAMREQLETLRKGLAESEAAAPASQETRDELARLTQRSRDEAKAVNSSSNNPLPYDLDSHLTPQLDDAASRLEELAERLERAQGAPSQGELAEELAQLEKMLSGQQEQLALEALEPLEHLERAYRLMADQARFVQLYKQQRDLEERMASLRDQDSQDNPDLEARLRDMETEQDQIRNNLSELLDDIDDHLLQLPDESEFEKLRQTAEKFVDALRGSGVDEAMQQAQSHLADRNATPGHDRAREAADLLEQFLSKCEAMEGDGQQCLMFNPSLATGLGQTVAQLMADAGMGMNNGLSGLAGGGMSAQRNSLDNVGLYGQLPALGGDGMGEQGKFSTAEGRQYRASRENLLRAADIVTGEKRSAAGTPEAIVPERYRARVRQYFQRIADEAGR